MTDDKDMEPRPYKAFEIFKCENWPPSCKQNIYFHKLKMYFHIRQGMYAVFGIGEYFEFCQMS